MKQRTDFLCRLDSGKPIRPLILSVLFEFGQGNLQKLIIFNKEVLIRIEEKLEKTGEELLCQLLFSILKITNQNICRSFLSFLSQNKRKKDFLFKLFENNENLIPLFFSSRSFYSKTDSEWIYNTLLVIRCLLIVKKSENINLKHETISSFLDCGLTSKEDLSKLTKKPNGLCRYTGNLLLIAILEIDEMLPQPLCSSFLPSFSVVTTLKTKEVSSLEHFSSFSLILKYMTHFSCRVGDSIYEKLVKDFCFYEKFLHKPILKILSTAKEFIPALSQAFVNFITTAIEPEQTENNFYLEKILSKHPCFEEYQNEPEKIIHALNILFQEKETFKNTLENIQKTLQKTSKTIYFQRTENSPLISSLLLEKDKNERFLSIFFSGKQKEKKLPKKKQKETVMTFSYKDEMVSFWKEKLNTDMFSIFECIEQRKVMKTVEQSIPNEECFLDLERVDEKFFFDQLLFSEKYHEGFLLSLSAKMIISYTRGNKNRILMPKETFFRFVVETGLAGFLVSLLTKENSETRKLARYLLGLFLIHLGRSVLHIKDRQKERLVLSCLLLESLRNTIENEDIIPTPVASFVIRSLSEITKKELYFKIKKTILNTPILSLKEIPLSDFLFSTERESSVYRIWILRVLEMSIKTDRDISFFKKNKIVSFLKSLLFADNIEDVSWKMCSKIVFKIGDKTETEFNAWSAFYQHQLENINRH